MSVLDVSPGLKGGHCDIQLLMRKEIGLRMLWVRHVSPAQVVETTQDSVALCDLFTAICIIGSQSRTYDRQADGYLMTQYSSGITLKRNLAYFGSSWIR